MVNNSLNNVSFKIDHLIEEAVIQNEVNFFMQELQESSFKDMTDKSKKMITRIVKAFQNPKKIDKIISGEKAAEERRKKYLKKYGINIDKFTRDLKEGKDISIPLKMLLEEIFSMFLDKNIKGKFAKNALGVFITILFISIGGYVFQAMMSFLPLKSASFLYPIIFAPLVEETMKRVSVKYNVSGFSFLGFNAMEISGKINKLTPNDMNLTDLSLFGLARSMAVLFHLITWMIHIKGNLLDKYKSDFKIEDNQKDTYKNVASFQAILLHSLYNGLPEFFGDVNSVVAVLTATLTGGLTVLQKTKAKKEFSRAVDKFLKPLRGQKIPAKITA